ncbi:MAG: hypothetical protein LBI88_02545 [Deltaproteobacteria bacterium]|nr:hypothetical protein [Deltaproteobacteria bacterium]
MELLALALLLTVTPAKPQKIYEMRVTGYYAEAGVRSALGELIRPGGTAAVSPSCIELLGERVYIKGYGVWRVNDLPTHREARSAQLSIHPHVHVKGNHAMWM